MLKHFGDNARLSTTVLTVFALIAVCAVILFYRKDSIDLQNLSMVRQNKDKRGSKYIKCQFFSNIGAQNYLMLEMSIPCENTTQYEDLNQKIDRIKSDMLININPEEMKKWVGDRNFVSIKGELLNIINRHANMPVEHIYFDSFLYQ